MFDPAHSRPNICAGSGEGRFKTPLLIFGTQWFENGDKLSQRRQTRDKPLKLSTGGVFNQTGACKKRFHDLCRLRPVYASYSELELCLPEPGGFDRLAVQHEK